MARKRYSPEELIAKLREADVALAQGKTVTDVVRQLGVTQVTFGSRHAPGMAALPQYRWRKDLGGMRIDQATRLKELERENARLRKAVSDLTLDKMILEEAAKGNW